MCTQIYVIQSLQTLNLSVDNGTLFHGSPSGAVAKGDTTTSKSFPLSTTNFCSKLSELIGKHFNI